MALYQNIGQPVQFYTAREFAHWAKKVCAGLDEQVIHHRNTHQPSFLIVRDSMPTDDFTLTFVRDDGTETELSGPGQPGISMFTLGTKDYIRNGLGALPDPLPCGRYYIKLEETANTYYSEWFNVSDQTGRMLEFRWRADCSVIGIPYEQLGSTFNFRFWVKDNHLVAPTTSTEEDVSDNGITRTVTYVRTRRKILFHDTVPEYIVDCFHAMKHHAINGIVLAIDPGGNDLYGSAPITTYSVEVETVTTTYGQRACLTSTAVQLIHKEDWSSACCDEELQSLACPIDDARHVDFSISESSDPESFSVGISVIVVQLDAPDGLNEFADHNGQIGVATGAHAGPAFEWSTPEVGEIFISDTDVFSGGDNVGYIAVEDESTSTGRHFIPLCPGPLSITGEGDTWTVVIDGEAASFFPGRFVRVIISNDGDDMLIATIPEATLIGGYTIDDPGPDCTISFEYFTHGCEYCTSIPAPVEELLEGS